MTIAAWPRRQRGSGAVARAESQAMNPGSERGCPCPLLHKPGEKQRPDGSWSMKTTPGGQEKPFPPSLQHTLCLQKRYQLSSHKLTSEGEHQRSAEEQQARAFSWKTVCLSWLAFGDPKEQQGSQSSSRSSGGRGRRSGPRCTSPSPTVL